MRNRALIILAAAFVVLLTPWGLKSIKGTKVESAKSLGATQQDFEKPSHPLIFFEENSFNEGIAKAASEDSSFEQVVYGGIIPHHLFPGFIIADFFYRLSQQSPQSIILIGPNHFERGNFKALSSIYSWDTHFGKVYPKDEIIDELVESNLIQIDEAVLEKEHSVAGIMPFIKYYLPQTEVVPIILSGFMSQEEVGILADSLKGYINKDTIIIAAVDFSHYLTNSQAKMNDQVSLEIMRNFDYPNLFSLNNDYLDSPASIATVLMTMQKLGKTNMEILHNTNSGELLKNDGIETTSYFSIAFY